MPSFFHLYGFIKIKFFSCLTNFKKQGSISRKGLSIYNGHVGPAFVMVILVVDFVVLISYLSLEASRQVFAFVLKSKFWSCSYDCFGSRHLVVKKGVACRCESISLAVFITSTFLLLFCVYSCDICIPLLKEQS